MSRLEQSEESMKGEGREPVYHDSIFPFIPIWWKVLILIFSFSILISIKDLIPPMEIPDGSFPFFIAVFLVILILSAAYKTYFLFARSPFEKAHEETRYKEMVGQIIPGGNGFFNRLLFYDDGLEIRGGLHRWFIPYECMEEVRKSSFPIYGILIKTHLPKVHRRFYIWAAFYMKEILEKIEEMRRERLEQLSKTSGSE